MSEQPSPRILIRIFPWIFSVLIIAVMYFLLRQQMNEDLEEAKLSLRQVHVEEKIMSLGKLEFMHYKFKDVVFFRTIKPFLEGSYDIPDSEPIAIVNGIAVGGIDFNKVDESNFKFSNDSVLTLILPTPKLFDYDIEKDIQMITDYDIEKEVVWDALQKLVISDMSDALKPMELAINEGHLDKIIEPVLESMTNEKITVRFSNSD